MATLPDRVIALRSKGGSLWTIQATEIATIDAAYDGYAESKKNTVLRVALIGGGELVIATEEIAHYYVTTAAERRAMAAADAEWNEVFKDRPKNEWETGGEDEAEEEE